MNPNQPRDAWAYVDQLAVNPGHARRARVRVASLYPPTGPAPTDEQIRAAVAATAPVEAPAFIEQPYTPDEEHVA